MRLVSTVIDLLLYYQYRWNTVTEPDHDKGYVWNDPAGGKQKSKLVRVKVKDRKQFYFLPREVSAAL